MMTAELFTIRDGATFSPCELYRFRLWRDLGNQASCVCFIMLNPSKAGVTLNDPTVRRCIGFALRWEYGWLDVVNLFPLRSTDPKQLWKAPESTDIQVHNIVTIIETAKQAQLVIAAWGAHERLLFRYRRDWIVERLLIAGVQLHCLGTTADGNPRHPLYLRRDEEPRLWSPP